MKKRGISMKLSMIAVLIGLTALTACDKPSGNSTETKDKPQFHIVNKDKSTAFVQRVLHDDVNNVTCWTFGESIDCIPDSALSPAKPATSSAPKAE